MNIDATDLILGRLASFVAKKALNGEKINIVNCENAVITGSREFVINEYQARVKRGTPFKGPYFPRMPDRLVKRTIKNMLPHKQERGRKALKSIICYIGIPEGLKNQEIITLKDLNISESKTPRFIYIKDIAKSFGKNV